jgi:hypothetical protein
MAEVEETPPPVDLLDLEGSVGPFEDFRVLGNDSRAG